jgi:hypothetical protein
MRLVRRKHMAREEFVDALRAIARNAKVEHTMTVRHEPAPMPTGGTVVFKREDGSESFRYPVYVGTRAVSQCHVPLINIHTGPITPATQITMEFQWNR